MATGFAAHYGQYCGPSRQYLAQDVGSNIISFFKQIPQDEIGYIMSAFGLVSTVTLDEGYAGTVTYQGQFHIINLSGSYFPTTQTGGLFITCKGLDGSVICGPIVGPLIAACEVKVITERFTYVEPRIPRPKREKKKPSWIKDYVFDEEDDYVLNWLSK
ncbi:hypothetical protein RIF29_15567 [Crotalaria pallida]|uniref:AT-hook motif nuclear-localized protein n=1 Tax=Crotalaria pallida TaxID=3830 RepID=A0AAN9FFT5_CROPI